MTALLSGEKVPSQVNAKAIGELLTQISESIDVEKNNVEDYINEYGLNPLIISKKVRELFEVLSKHIELALQECGYVAAKNVINAEGRRLAHIFIGLQGADQQSSANTIALPHLAEGSAVSESEPQNQKLLRLPLEIPEAERYKAWSEINGGGIYRFFQEGWPAPYVKVKMLERAELGRLDEDAYKALENVISRCRRLGRALPELLNLPTQAYVPIKAKLTHAEQEALRKAEQTARELRSTAKVRE
jgi:hypothetical protein